MRGTYRTNYILYGIKGYEVIELNDHQDHSVVIVQPEISMLALMGHLKGHKPSGFTTALSHQEVFMGKTFFVPWIIYRYGRRERRNYQKICAASG